jgi:iron(III) transport system ATP-binding protein
MFTARFLGVSNSLDGVVDSVDADGAKVLLGPHSMLCRSVSDARPGQHVSVFMRPESFRLSRRRHSDDAWPGTIEFSIYHGDCWDYHVRIDGDLIKVRVYQEKVGLSYGDAVFLEPDPDSAIVMPSDKARAPSPGPGPEADPPEADPPEADPPEADPTAPTLGGARS